MDEVNPTIVRDALRKALGKQKFPTPARWCRLLGLPFGKNQFFEAADFTHAHNPKNMPNIKVHVSVFKDCFSKQANGEIGVFKGKSKKKHTPGEVISMLFYQDVDKILRVHASLEIEISGKKKPHAYYGAHCSNFPAVFDAKIAAQAGTNRSWIAAAEKHAREELAKFMAAAQTKAQVWLNKDGAV